ncbi:unnamed protein product [Boreogadus saida]
MEKYEKLKKIGEGSFGKAILVKSIEDGRQYVIKEIGISRMSSRERQESRKEVAVLANMSHPNIVQYKESFEEAGCLYIVMDYCEGGDLFRKINSQRGGPFPEEQVLDWFVQICLALKHVHDRKILHRDIKSQNIFLTKHGAVQLGDFGIARVLNSTVELARTCIGTPYYLSPEICENKPYNNKSDVWALGCVLYEMCTLKHAFEAGNMKNLVLKIIRGSYPPVSLHYSQDLRSLLGLLFRRNPRERPSVGTVLQKPFLCCRIHKFLSPQIIAQEFSPAFLHKQPPGGVAPGLPAAKRPAQTSTLLSPAQKITKPAAKYGVPLAPRRVSEGARRPRVAAATPQRRVCHAEDERKKHEDAVRKKRAELLEKERKHKEQVLLLKAGQVKSYEREKMNRINQAREQGWKHVLGASGGGSPERKGFGKRAGGAGPGAGPSLCIGPAPFPAQAPPSAIVPAHGRAAYDHYHTNLSREGSPVRGVPAAAGPLPPQNPDAVRKEIQRLQSVSRQAHIHRHRAQVGAGRGCQVEQFLQRKREAMLNKVRAEGQLEYLTRLRQIRLQNFNERQQMKARMRGEKYDSDGSDSVGSSEEAELRRKKIEVLKAQASVRAAVLQEQLERRRKEASQKAWEEHLVARGVKVAVAAGGDAGSPVSSMEPTSDLRENLDPADPPPLPVISMTTALKEVGANSVRNEDALKTETAEIQREKKEILRRLNQNRQLQSPVEEEPPAPPPPPPAPLPPPGPVGPAPPPQDQAPPPSEERPTSGGDRRRWEAGAPVVLALGQQTLNESCINADQTVGEVIRMGVALGEGPRKAWGRSPDSLVLRVLQEAELQSLTQTILGDSSPCQDNSHLGEGEGPSPPAAPPSDPRVRGQEEGGVTAPVPDLDQGPGAGPGAGTGPGATSDLTEILDPLDLEAVVLGPCTQQRARPPAEVKQVWQPPPPQPPEGAVAPAEAAEKPPDPPAPPPWEEPLFSRLCSPAHRRTLALLSAQSSLDDSSCSLASRSRSVSPLRSSQHRDLLLGLSAGLFDSPNPKMLRTCSLPDLSLLFSSTVAPGDDPPVAPDNHLEAKDDDQSEAEDGYEDEDLRELRASMERLLQEEEEEGGDFPRSPPEEEEEEREGDFNGNPEGCAAPPLLEAGGASEEEEEGGGAPEEEEEEEELNHMVEDDDEEEEESNGSPGDEEVEDLLTNGVEEEEEEEEEQQEEEEEEHSRNSQLNEEWHSDSSGEEAEQQQQHQDSIFSRLEELRFNLEQLMGFENFIEAYNKIKAIHEDEEESIELGSSLVLSILGTQHQHLYPNILHLVMADGAYQEDNDE